MDVPMLKFIAAFSLALAITACEKSDKNVLKIGTSGDNPPFEYFENGELVGFDIDFGKALAHKMGKQVQFIDMPFDSLIASLHAKKVDLVLSAISPTPEREKAVDFSEDYHRSSNVLITAGLTTVDSVAKLSGQVVGVQLGSTFEAYAKETLKKHVQNVEVRSLGKLTDVIQGLRTGRIAALITGIGEADRIIENNPSFKALSLPEASLSEAAAFPKGSRLVDIVDEMISTLEADGSLQNLRMKWKLN